MRNRDTRKVIYVTNVAPSAIGHGGTHRSYQILHELEQVVGPGQVLLFTKHQLLAAMQQNDSSGKHFRRLDSKIRERATHRIGTTKRILKNPYRLIQRTQFATGIHPGISSYYERQVKNLDSAVCVMEHAEFADLIPINQRYKIPTISCTQNLDAFSQNFELLSANLKAKAKGNIGVRETAGIYAAIVDFANELQILAQCDERLFISKLEAGLIGGLGLSAQYYPYLPVGAIRSRLMTIREKRARSIREAGLFVLIGTATYGPIKKSCDWLIQSARENGLPVGVRIIVVGSGTEALLAAGESLPGIELKGWVEQEEMDELLAQATAVLVPQRYGFGVPTRLAELSCAGVPTIGDRHPTFAVDPPPGFNLVGPAWSSWCSKIEELKNQDTGPPEEEYVKWESDQGKPLVHEVSRMFH